MKFREYSDLKPIVIESYNNKELEQEVEKLSQNYNIIDLQYSTTDVPGLMNHGVPCIHYSVFILAQTKNL